VQRILVITWLELRHGREIFRGVFDYVRDHGLRWRLISVPLEKAGGRLPHEPMADGAVVATVSQEFADWTAARASRVVNVAAHPFGRHWPTVCQDDHAIGELAARHLAGLGFKHFAGLGKPGHGETPGRLTGFVQTLLDEGFASIHIAEHSLAQLPEPLRSRVQTFEKLSDLPRPSGLLATNCYLGQEAILGCEAAGRHVPQDIAVLAADEDEFLAHTAYPPLSTVEIHSRLIGYRAAQMLDGMLSGQAPDSPLEKIPPVRVIPRQSTNVIAVDDPHLSAAMRYIQDHAHEAINVEDVVSQGCVNRRTLERRFAAAFGRTPHEAIMEAKLKIVRDLLTTTSMSVEQIAHRTGFCSPSHLSQMFRKHARMTPRAYRDQHR